MRYLLGFVLFLLALGTLRVVGCGGEPQSQPCQTDDECDDQNDCTSDECRADGSSTVRYCRHGDAHVVECDFNRVNEATEDGICVRPGLVCTKKPCDDGNECTDDTGIPPELPCEHIECTGCGPCDWDGVPGVRIDGVCGENICQEGVCDDDDECTIDWCDFVDGCYFVTASDGTSCDFDGLTGVCIDGVCGQDPCEVVVCDDGDLCTDDHCWLGECSHGMHCHDDNVCTEDICDAETGECSYPPADGERCCLLWICFSEPCSCWTYGTCLDRRCVSSTEAEAFEVQP